MSFRGYWIDRLCPMCGNNDCVAQKWGGDDLRVCCRICGHCWTEQGGL